MSRHLLSLIVLLPPLVYGVISLLCARSFFRRKSASSGFTPPVTIMKPVKGASEESFDLFAGFCRQEYPAAVQIVFALASADDPAVTVVEALMAAYPAVDITLVVDPRIHGPNYKVCNLINGWPRVKHDIVIICDSDIRVAPDYLLRVTAPFADSAVGLVTSLYRSPAVRGAATAMEALGFTTEMVPNVMVAMKLEGLSFALGASMAVRREALEAIGGFTPLADYLADDYQLGNRIHRAGYRLELSECFVESVMQRESLASVLSRQLRWARTMRVSRPGGYFCSGLILPFPAIVAAWALSGFSTAGTLPVLLFYLFRCAVAIIFSRRFLRDNLFPRWLWLLPLRDMLAFFLWAGAFLGNRVRWRGHLYRLCPGGEMVELKGGRVAAKVAGP